VRKFSVVIAAVLMGASAGQAFAKDVCVQASGGLGIYVFKGVKSLTKLGQVSPITGFNIDKDGLRHPISGTATVAWVDPADKKNIVVSTGFTVLQGLYNPPYTVQGDGQSLSSAEAYVDVISGTAPEGEITWAPIDCNVANLL